MIKRNAKEHHNKPCNHFESAPLAQFQSQQTRILVDVDFFRVVRVIVVC